MAELQKLIAGVDFSSLLNVIAGVIAFFIAYLKIVPLLPRSSSKILSDIDLYSKTLESGVGNAELIKESIERNIKKRYSKSPTIHNLPLFLTATIPLVGVCYMIYERLISDNITAGFFILLFIAFMLFALAVGSFSESKTHKEGTIEEKKDRQHVIRISLYSWSELVMGIFFTSLFSYYTYYLLFDNGTYSFNGWALLTFVVAMGGLSLMTRAFKKQSE